MTATRQTIMILSKRRHPRIFLLGVRAEFRLDSRYKHAGMTDLRGLEIPSTQQAAGN